MRVKLDPIGRISSLYAGSAQTKLGKATKSCIAKTCIAKLTLSRDEGIVEDKQTFSEHGGKDRAVLAMPENNYRILRKKSEGDPALAPDKFYRGRLGENFCVDGPSVGEEDVRIGDVWRVGKGVLLEVCQPRIPCYKVDLRTGYPLKKLMEKTSRTGYFLRVMVGGSVSIGDKIYLFRRGNHTILRANRLLKDPHPVSVRAFLLSDEALAPAWASKLVESVKKSRDKSMKGVKPWICTLLTTCAVGLGFAASLMVKIYT